MLGYGVGALVRFKCNEETHPKKQGTTRETSRSDKGQGTRTGQPERPTGKARKRRPDRANPTSLPWELERDARGRQETTLLFRSEGAGSWVGALCLLLGSWVGARGQCTEPSAC